MKKWWKYIWICLLCVGWTACVDEDTYGYDGPMVELKLNLSLPGGSRVAGDYNEELSGLDHETMLERYISNEDIYVLAFEYDTENDTEGKLFAVPELKMEGTQGAYFRTLTASLPYSEKTYTLQVLVNLAQNGCLGTTTAEVISALEDKIGQSTAADIQKNLIFNYPDYNEQDGGTWKLTEEGRYLPMWGKPAKTFTFDRDVHADCNLYRGVAKMEVRVDEDCENFELKEVRVYYVNEQGQFISSKIPNTSETIQYKEPCVPATATQRSADKPLVYTLAKDTTEQSIKGIYVTESNNINPGNGKERLYMEVEGLRNGETRSYRIDMMDDKDSSDGTKQHFDIIRNHSYIFNIRSVTERDITVEIEDYEDVPMKGINSQYTLNVDNSVFGFDGLVAEGLDLNIWTDGTEWELSDSLDFGVDGNIKLKEWFRVTDNVELHTNTRGRVTILPKANVSGRQRTGYFYIIGGKIKKRITVIQEPTETANSYIVSEDKEYILFTGVPGNRNKWSSDNPIFNPPAWDAVKDTSETFIGYDDVSLSQPLTLNVDHIGIIWETVQGLIMVEDPQSPGEYKALHNFTSGVKVNAYNGCIPYKVDANKKDQWGGKVLTADHGGNALIGGFDKSNKLVWSWHIWVLGDYKTGVKEEDWVTGIYFMDRYLGAYSRNPGSRSYGLLYQWGRKDPFIGPTRDIKSNGKYERDYTKVDKAQTTNYVLHEVDYKWRDWVKESDGDEKVLNSVPRPTVLMKSGILNDKETMNAAPDNIKGIWGTKDMDTTIVDNGAKTMWDPCPPGYRVPSLRSWFFEDSFPTTFQDTSNGGGKEGQKYNSYIQNYDSNVFFVPEYNGVRSYKYYWPVNDQNSIGYQSENYDVPYDTTQPFYGFWLSFRSHRTPEASNTNRPVNPVGTDNAGMINSNWTRDNFTWLPIGGVYNGTIDHFGSCGSIATDPKNDPVPASSIHINSVIWLNSPLVAVPNKQDTDQTTEIRPAGVFLHGTEGRYDAESQKDIQDSYILWGRNYNKAQGRHIHYLNHKTKALAATPNMAGNVRCVRDKDALEIEENSVSGNLEPVLSSDNGYKAVDAVTINAVETWRIISPGAPWVTVTPDRGLSPGEYKLTISCEAPAVGETDLEATITIQFSRGQLKSILVTRQ